MRLTEEQYRVLSRGTDKLEPAFVPRGKPGPARKGNGWAARVPCPVITGNSYEAWAKVRDKGGNIERKTVVVTVVELTESTTADGWDVLLIAGDRSDRTRFMARGGGDVSTPGYVGNAGRALDPDAPCVPEADQIRWSQEAFERDATVRAQRIKMAREGLSVLYEGGRDEKRAARQMERQLDKLEVSELERELLDSDEREAA